MLDHHDANGVNAVNPFNQYIINKPQQLMQLSNNNELRFQQQAHTVNNTATICQQPIYQQNLCSVPIVLQLQPQQQVIQQQLIQHQAPINPMMNTINTINTRNNEVLFVMNANGQILGRIHHNNNDNMYPHHIPVCIDPNVAPKIDLKIPALPHFAISPSTSKAIIHQSQSPSKSLPVHTDNTSVKNVRSHSSNKSNTLNASSINNNNNNKAFICSVCGKQYKYRCNYKSHFKIHTDDCYKCEFCGKKFGRKSNYREHVRVHTGESPFKCKFCEKRFKQRHGWKDHLRVHTGEKPYQCDICNKRFSVGHNLNVHKRIHSGERPFQCNLCNKAYRQKSAFNSHSKNVHGIILSKKEKI